MPKTPDDVKKGLFVCSDFEGNCPYCPYAVNGHRDPEGMCVKQLANDADKLIRQLEPQRDGLLQRVMLLQDAVDQWEFVATSPGAVEDMARENTELLKKVEQLQAERDAAVADLRRGGNCFACKNWKTEVCFACQYGRTRRFEWRGVPKEE